jgi:hypothetical protein
MTGKYEDSELVDFGFAHNTPMDKGKVKLVGNATQDGGIPFDWAAIRRREADAATVEENMERLLRVLRQHDWPVEGVLAVGDRAMLNSRLAIVYDDHKTRGLYYLAGVKPRTKEHKELLASVPLRELTGNHLLGRPGHRYWGVKRPITFTYEGEETGAKKQVTHTTLIVVSEASRRSWRHKRVEQLRALSAHLQEEVKDKLNQPYWRNPKTIRKRVQSRPDDSPVDEVMKVEVWGEYGAVQMQWWVDRDALRDLCRLDGRYLLVTADPTLSSVEMLQIYKDKDRLEKRFQVAKQVLRVRPIHLHKDERIEAMLLVNMIALLVYSLAERQCRRGGLQITGRQMLYEFAPLHVIETHCWDGTVLYRCMPLTPGQQDILQRMGLARAGSACPGQGRLALEHFYDSYQLVDWYHATEHLAAAARLLKGEGTPAAQRWYHAQETVLFQGQAGWSAEVLATAAQRQREGTEQLEKEAGYFRHNKRRMNYLEMREEGWVIGSGMVESTGSSTRRVSRDLECIGAVTVPKDSCQCEQRL